MARKDTADRLALIRQWLAQFETLDNRGVTDEIGWIALKLSCSRDEAEQWIKRARA